MRQKLLALLLAGFATTCFAGVNENLLSAQMAYQSADGNLKNSQLRMQASKSKHTLAEQRLADAQNALADASAELASAQSTLTAAEEAMSHATSQLQQAWQNKEAAQ
ncbi:efflux RND transporter periplasmic adaptor subunit [Craterilacuibacter sinensis]|uniref:Uncharacterized protein n=1 Tax=Craterilacuibacter sinensis TaxID=2686017 RepID=A0A845BVL8_9NEIS|nr:hypothetical protein [Craterilacuibacter sinensis]MXR36553.1 hypothetical protein [Craterilacuibacter sinensis]